jgi:DNA-binding NtrC family response regulator
MSKPRVSHEARPIRILLVEDDADDAELMRARFAEAGLRCELERVESSPTFRAALGRGAVDLVLADYSLPRFDGLAVLEVARELRPDVPVVLVSGVIDEALAIETLKLGATDYVLKQRLDRLVPVVLRALREREGRRRTFLELREATREVRDCAAAPGSAAKATLDDAITQLELLLARALGEVPRA